MWEKLIEFSKQLLFLTKQVEDNSSEITDLRTALNRLGGGTHRLINEIKLLKQQHAYEIQSMKEKHDAELRRLEEQICRLEERYTNAFEKASLSVENQVLRAINEMQNPRKLTDENSFNRESNSDNHFR